MKLKIDPDFKNLIPPLSAEEYEQLEQNIVAEKCCRDAILIWKKFIVDGHNRHAICTKHKIPLKVSKLQFASKREALIWIAENQLGRRNLSDAVRIDIATRRAHYLMIGGQHEFRKSIAEAAGVGEQKVYRYMKVIQNGDAETIEKLRRGEMKIGTAYNQMNTVVKIVKDIELWSRWYIQVVDKVLKVGGVYWGVAESGEYEEIGFADWYLGRQLVRVDGCLEGV